MVSSLCLVMKKNIAKIRKKYKNFAFIFVSLECFFVKKCRLEIETCNNRREEKINLDLNNDTVLTPPRVIREHWGCELSQKSAIKLSAYKILNSFKCQFNKFLFQFVRNYWVRVLWQKFWLFFDYWRMGLVFIDVRWGVFDLALMKVSKYKFMELLCKRF